MKKSICFFLAFSIILGFVLAGCGGSSGIDSTKSQLYVYNYNGGIGTLWLDILADEFEEKYKEISFEPGKKGVQIIVQRGKDSPTVLSNSMYQVLFTQGTPYNDFISKKQLIEITDIVVEKSLSDVSDGKENGTIADKMDKNQIEAFTAVDGKHYVLPHYECYPGLTYDVDLFIREKLFFKEGGGWTNIDSEKTVGPDGERNTYDDGLPSSYEEFYKLIKQMRKVGVTPFIWTGQYTNYVTMLILGLWVAYCGEDEYMLNVNFGSGEGEGVETEIITSFTETDLFTDTAFKGKEPNTQMVTITPEDGYKVFQQAGRYYAMTVLESILSDKGNFSDKINAVLSHTGAQEEFILSDLENKPIGMIIEGSYWYNEAVESGAVKRSVNVYKEKAQNRNFAWMPLPRQIKGTVIEGNGKKNTLIEELGSFCFINGTIKDKPNIINLAKTFLQFLYTDENLVKFTLITGVAKGVNYQIPSDKLATMNKYYQSLYKIRQDSDIIYPYSNHPIFVNNQSSFSSSATGNYWQSTIEGTPYAYPYPAFDAGKNAVQYFEGMKKTQSQWSNLYSRYW
jgi:ABC-type glycerol-3-phosphate transport system substrate-binding protein